MTSKLLFVLLFLSGVAHSQSDLQTVFQHPPNGARPRVWWHWMNGNISKEGIKKDLEWMKNVGIGGFQNFDANLFTPLVVPRKIEFMQPEWKDAFRYATELANTLELEMAIAGSPGWSETGGPWVPAQDGMKKYVWTETRVKGGQAAPKLTPPPSATGRFQSAELSKNAGLGQPAPVIPEYYHDAFVVAFRLPPAERSLSELKPLVSASGGTFSLAELTDGNLNNAQFLPPQAVGEDMWIQYTFDKPQTFKSVSIAGAILDMMSDFNGGPLNRSLKISDDGVTFREIAGFTSSVNPQNTISFPAATARYWRLCYKTLPPPVNPLAAMFGGNPQAEMSEGVHVAEFVLYTTDRVDQFEDKAGFTPWKEGADTYVPVATDVIGADQVIDLSANMKPDGALEWTAPAGADWCVLRFGYSLTGRQNHPASPEATGLEVDKLDPDAVRRYINTYLDMYKDATGGLMGAKGLTHLVLDSYEAGHMTWTAKLPAEFAKRRGYNIQPWLPVLAGRIVQNSEASEKFLWDFRKTIGELIAENHYDVIGEELHRRGMKRYTESHEDRRIFLADGMDVKRKADVPMAAMWTPGSLAGGDNEEVRSEADIRESASVSHIYGQNIVAAESMTAIKNSFAYTPERLKRTADLEMASGLNRFVIHTSVHQPLDDKMPGFSLGPFGQWFTRHETWGPIAKPWVDYLSRSCAMLQQGKPVVDILYYYGENTNITWQFREKLPDLPYGYSYDFVNSTALMNALRVSDGKIVTPGGTVYSILVLDESAREMTVPVLKKLRTLVHAGVRVAGARPERSPSLADDPATFTALVQEIWGSPNVSTGKSVAEILKTVGVEEDVTIQQQKARVVYVHRKTADADIYWLNSRSNDPNEADFSFRTSGKKPEIWRPQTGKTEPVSYRIEGGRTYISLKFDPWDAYFVVFREKTTQQSFVRPPLSENTVCRIDGPWSIEFQQGRGAPASTRFDKLESWTENADPGIRYFSGTATYRSSFKLPLLEKNALYVIDLGEVKNIAEVIVNGKNMGFAWKTPFRVDISEALKQGDNAVEIRVTNLWVNRLIGDAQPGVTQKITFTTLPFYRADAPLLPSGLLSEVRVLVRR